MYLWHEGWKTFFPLGENKLRKVDIDEGQGGKARIILYKPRREYWKNTENPS